MYKLVIIRFGTPELLKAECEIIESTSLNLERTFTFPFPPIGTIHVLETELSSAEMATKFKEAQEKSGVLLPVMVMPLETFTIEAEIKGHNLFEALQVFFGVAKAELLQTEQKPKPQACELSLDQILDLVNQKGVEGLSKTEKLQLQKLSENL